MNKIKYLETLTDCFSRLPSVGQKSAERMALSVLDMDDSFVESFANALLNVKTKIHKCPTCGFYTTEDFCEICTDEERTSETLIVVSYPKDIYAFEKIAKYNWRYHILGGDLSVTKGISPENLSVDKLLDRISKENVKEIIIATNPNLEGETTALYLGKILEGRDVAVSRLAYGLPMGGHLDYADTLTLDKALEGRRKI